MLEQIEIRRITDQEGEPVAQLWDRMCREIPDGGPLTEQGRRNIARWLAMSAWHHHAFCLVAVAGPTIVGFVNGRTDIGDGLLPGLAGVVESLYVVPEHRGAGTSSRLAEAAIAWLRERGARIIRTEVCIDSPASQRVWLDLGFERDMVVLSQYG